MKISLFYLSTPTCLWIVIIYVFASSQVFAVDKKNELVLLNWSEYMDPVILEKFEKQTGVHVREIYFETDDLRNRLFQESNGKGYDLIMIDGASLHNYVKIGGVNPIDKSAIPNLTHLDAKWVGLFEGTADYAVPYFWGTIGIVYRADLVDQPLTSWMDLFQPQASIRGKIMMIRSSLDLLGMALKANGHSINSIDKSEIKLARNLLKEQKKHVKGYSYLSATKQSAILSGEIVAAMIYNGDALVLRGHSDNVEYIMPKEGGNLWADYWAVAASSTNKEMAYQFLNFINEPENAAQLAEYVYFATPNKAARKHLSAEHLSDPTIYPSKEILSRYEAYSPKSYPARIKKFRNEVYSSIVD